MKEKLLNNWTFLRALRLGLGFAFIYAGWMQGDWIPGLIGGMFTYQSIMNAGCAGGNCYVPPVQQPASSKPIQDIDFEEIK